MCFYVSPESSKELTAKKDIVCYKRVDVYYDYKEVDAYSGYGFPVPINYYFLPEVKRDTNVIYKIGVKRKIRRKLHIEEIQDIEIINYGFHSVQDYKTYFRPLWDSSHQAILKCHIPAGSKYYKNKDEYVSDTIIPVEVEYASAKATTRIAEIDKYKLKQKEAKSAKNKVQNRKIPRASG